MAVLDPEPASHKVDASFAGIADADVEVLLKQLTQDEKVSLLGGTYTFQP
jgi:hypothetical protein